MVASRFQWAVRFSTRLETDSLVGALGFEPLHLRIGIRPDSQLGAGEVEHAHLD